MNLKTIRDKVQDLYNANTMSQQISMDSDQTERKLTSNKITNHIILIMNAIKGAERDLEYLEEGVDEWTI